MIRPLYLIVSIRLLREYVKRYLYVIQDSLPMVLFTVVYILYFSGMGQRLFSGTLEGVQFFDSFGNSFFNMLVLMTTSNFPDIMLPAYQRNRLACLYFIIYLILGLFLMMNLLLAIFYSNFKFRFE
jgi:two pore calcium channel protein 1